MKKIYIKLPSLVILFFLSNILCAQHADKIYGSSVWIKEDIATLDADKAKLEEKLNFNRTVNLRKFKIPKKISAIVNRKSSLFIVYKSTTVKETNLLSLERGSFQVILSNKKMYSDREVILDKGDAATGSLLSYIFNKNSWVGKKRGNLIFEDIFYSNDNPENVIAELIYIPEILNAKEKASVETYLSLKFGISLEKDKDYINSAKDTIWNAKDNKDFSNRVTGIGRDDFFKLNQKQSRNSLNDGLTIGLDTIQESNFENKTRMSDKAFLIWGDNGKMTLLENKDRQEEKRMQRVWKLQARAKEKKEYTTQIIIDKNSMTMENEKIADDKNFIWLAVDSLSTSEFDYSNAEYIKATVNDDQKIVFNDIKWNSDKTYFFTVTKGPEKNTKKTVELKQEEKISGQGGYKVYPNPAEHNENFMIDFNLQQTSLVSITITDINGRVLRTKDLCNIKEYIHTEKLQVSGTYLIIVSIDGAKETNKIIIK